MQIGIQSKRFNQGHNTAIRLPQSWNKSGSVRLVDFGGRHNVLCLQSRKNAARITHKIALRKDRPYTFSIDIYSPVDNEGWGTGRLSGDHEAWHPSNGMWKRLSVQIKDGTRISIKSTDKDKAIVQGDKCYVDLASISIK